MRKFLTLPLMLPEAKRLPLMSTVRYPPPPPNAHSNWPVVELLSKKAVGQPEPLLFAPHKEKLSSAVAVTAATPLPCSMSPHTPVGVPTNLLPVVLKVSKGVIPSTPTPPELVETPHAPSVMLDVALSSTPRRPVPVSPKLLANTPQPEPLVAVTSPSTPVAPLVSVNTAKG